VLLVAAVAALFLSIADAAEPTTTPPSQVRYVGETMSYSLHAVMTQSIAGDDAFGRHVSQTSAPTSLKLHEQISITKTTSQDLGMHRSGSITATVDGAKPVNKDGQGWTTISNNGIVVHDRGKLGGLFLLPLPFLADAAMHNGQELTVGDTWSGELGTKLYGMTARPRLTFSVTSERLVGDGKVYFIDATGTVPMKEPVMTTSGEPLGYATGIADITAHIEYDRVHRRLISMRAQLSDVLHYKGPTKRSSGHVKDRQQCEVSLDQEAVAGGQAQADDPSPGPQP
jgi:hypothetical protein